MTIDVCKVYGPDTIFLQQAAHLTNGSYIYLERRDALLQYLIVISFSSLLYAVANDIVTADVLPVASIHP